MDTILVLMQSGDGKSVPESAKETITVAQTLAQELGADWHIGALGQYADEALKELAGCGAKRFLAVSGEAVGSPRYSSDSKAAQTLCTEVGATVILAPADNRLERIIGGVCQRLNGKVDTHVNKVWVQDGQMTITRWAYRQRLLTEVQRTTRPWILTIEPGVHPAWQGDTATDMTVEPVEIDLDSATVRTTVTGVHTPEGSDQTIHPDADLLFVAGAGWTKKQSDGNPHLDKASQLILDFLHLSGASLGSTKSLVDLKGEGEAVLPFMTHLNQVGQTGSTPRHPKGLATCCHGEEPHVVGWRFINERRAINLDPNCGWAQGKADVLYVADAFKVVEKMKELLNQ
jgi:electron transfer flavoprotein alpha subunit